MRTVDRPPYTIGRSYVQGFRRTILGPALLLSLAIPLAACNSNSSSPSPTATSAAGAQTTATAGGATAKSVSLTLKDMPAGYTQVQAQAVSLPQQQYTAYYVSFNNSADSPTIVTQSKVAKFVNLKGATSTYPHFVGNAHLSGGYSQTGSVSGLGSQSTTGTKTTTHSNGTQVVQFGVVFQQGVFLALVSSTGPKGKVSQQQVNALANVIDQNITSGK